MSCRVTLLAALLAAGTAGAFSSGITSASFPNQATGCNGCHNSPGAMMTPTVTLTPSSSTATSGQALTLTFVITNAGQSAAGLNLRASAGTLSAIDANTQKLNGQITHALNGKTPVNGAVTFTASWTAPSTAGNVTFTAWGNSVNLNGLSSGDRAASTTATVTVSVTCTPSAEICDNIDNNCNQQIDELLCPVGQQCVPGGGCLAPDAGTSDGGVQTDGGVDGGAGGGGGGTTGRGPIGGGGPAGGGGGGAEEPNGCGCTSMDGGLLATMGAMLVLFRARRKSRK